MSSTTESKPFIDKGSSDSNDFGPRAGGSGSAVSRDREWNTNYKLPKDFVSGNIDNSDQSKPEDNVEANNDGEDVKFHSAKENQSNENLGSEMHRVDFSNPIDNLEAKKNNDVSINDEAGI